MGDTESVVLVAVDYTAALCGPVGGDNPGEQLLDPEKW